MTKATTERTILTALLAVLAIGAVWVLTVKILTYRRVKKFLVEMACKQGELDNYYNKYPLANIDQIYDRAEHHFEQFHVSRRRLAQYGDGGNKEVFHTSRRFGKAIVESCGSANRTLSQATMLVSQFLRHARSRFAKSHH